MMLAYLDPGSGSALVGTLIALAGALCFSLKSLFYRIVCGKKMRSGDEGVQLALFSEGKAYWGTFQEIIEELIARKIHFAYYTLDLRDPGLLIDSDYMHAKLFDARKATSYHKLSRINAKVLLATTPNIGTPNYPLKRSAGIEKMVHVFHAFADISAYHIGSLDHYDVVLTVGPQQEVPIREVENARGLKPKVIIPVGLPYFDVQYHRLEGAVPKAQSERRMQDKPTILIGASWGAKGLLSEYGTKFICDLAKAGYHVIVRPHPQSYIAEPAFIAKCQMETAAFENVIWDRETTGVKAMQMSDVLISDTSSIRFDYAFLYKKPVITLEIPAEKRLEYEGQFMREIWTEKAAHRLGKVLTHQTLSTVVEVVKEVLTAGGASSATSISDFRDETMVNIGISAKAVVDFLQKEMV